jgi:transcriptional regulator with XRE-family HTH domain
MIETRGAMSWERRGMKADTIIAKVRRELGINQTEFARLCGIGSTQMVSKYESGRTLPKLEVVMRVIEVARKNNIAITLEDFGGKYRG